MVKRKEGNERRKEVSSKVVEMPDGERIIEDKKMDKVS